MGTKFKVSLGAGVLLLITIATAGKAQETQQQPSTNSAENGKGSTSSSESVHSHPRIVNLKHRRYKSLRDNVTSSHERIALPTSTIEAASHPILHEHIHFDDLSPHHEHPLPHLKSGRNGFQIQKAPPDLQFGLAFTVPFVSLSTEKLLNTVSGKRGDGGGFDSVSSLLKLNFSGLLLAAVVGLIAAAGIFLPSFLNTGGGFNPHGFLEGLFPPHFTGTQYNDYGNGWGDKSNWKNDGDWNKDWNGRRNGRAENALSTIGVGVLRLMDKFKSGVSTVEKCVVQRVCEEKKSGKGGRLSSLVSGLQDNEVVKDVGVYKVIRKVVDGDYSVCAKVEAIEMCKEFSGVEESVLEIVNGWRRREKEAKGGGSGGSGGSPEGVKKE